MTPPATPPDTSPHRVRIATGSGLLAGGLAYFLTLLNYSTDLTRTALAPGYFSQFFDLQGRALLDGQLAVPDGSLGIEGFLHDGNTYTYFPPWPAILRLPVLMTTHEFDSRLTLLSMAVAWIVLAVMVTKLIWLLLRVLSDGDSPTPTRLQCVFAALFIAGATGGTFLTYDASLPWVYHEVYMWAVTGAVGALYWMARVVFDPSRDAVKWLFVFALISVGSRATEGAAVCVVAVALALFMRLRRSSPQWSPAWATQWRWVLLAGLVPAGCSILINELKFGTVYSFPLDTQVWTQISEQRQAALAANGGTLTGPQFFPTSFMAYLRLDGIRFVDYFPWITLPAHPAPPYAGAVLDQTYRTGSVPAFMPLFFVLLAIALLAAFRPRAEVALARLRWPLASAILVTGGVMAYGYYANRYVSDFMPAVIMGAAVGTVLVVRFIERRRARAARRRWWPIPVGLGYGALVIFSIAAHMSTGFTAAAYQHRGEPLERYLSLQERFSPTQQAERVTRIEGLPSGGTTDDIAIVGQCDALYLHTGDLYEPWITVQDRDRVIRITYDREDLTLGTTTVLTVDTTRQDRLDFQVNSAQQFRFVVYLDGETRSTPWTDPSWDGVITVGIRNRIDFSSYEFTVSPGGVAGFLPSFYLDEQERSLPAELQFNTNESEFADRGVTAVEEPGFPLALCEQIAHNAGIDVSTDVGG